MNQTWQVCGPWVVPILKYIRFGRTSSQMAAVTWNRKFLNWRIPPYYMSNTKHMVRSFLSYIPFIVNFTL
jgi:hypothetical protein